MDQDRIGKFIAELRKEKNLTQEQLAEKMNITKNAVSKWERGICLMDMSLLKPLSEILGVSITEILNGERIESEQLVNRSEETIIKLSKLYDYKSKNYGIIGMALFFMVLIIISMFKNIQSSSLVSLLCAYNAVTFLSRYKFNKDKADLFTGILFLIATILNIINFIII